MSEYNQEKLTQDVLAAFANTPDPRLRELMTALVKHVHAFAREVDLKPDEWLAGMKFLDAIGRLREAEVLGQRHEVPKMPQLHVNPRVESMASIISM